MPQNDLPFDLIAYIFSKLPVKTLKRFKSLSKLYCSLIEDPRFINSHLIQSLETSHNLRLVLIYTMCEIFTTRPEETPIYFTGLNSVNSCSFEKINSMLRGISKVLGSCNGLLCLMNWKQRIILWNMATREYHIVSSTRYGPLTSRSRYGFGYNSIVDDYKFMRAEVISVSDDNSLVTYATSVYSFRSGTWRYRIFSGHYYISGYRKAVFDDGSFYWIGFRGLIDRGPSHLIVSFDLGTEEFNEVCLPDGLSSPGEVNGLNLSVLGGVLCVMRQGRNNCSDLWIMKDDKVKGSWSKLFSVIVEDGLWCPRPLAYSRYGDKILMQDNSNNLFWYDPVKEQVENVDNIPDCMHLFSAEICPESLVELRVYRGIHGIKRQAPQEAQKYSRLKIKF